MFLVKKSTIGKEKGEKARRWIDRRKEFRSFQVFKASEEVSESCILTCFKIIWPIIERTFAKLDVSITTHSSANNLCKYGKIRLFEFCA